MKPEGLTKRCSRRLPAVRPHFSMIKTVPEIFVRSMRTQLLLVSLLLAGCAATPMPVPPIKIIGPYASTLSRHDVQQIQQLAIARSDIGGTVRTIEAVRPNRVRAESGHPIHSGWSGIAFFSVRHHGTWYIDDHTQLEGVAERTFVTY
jgi:hypothetical protein